MSKELAAIRLAIASIILLPSSAQADDELLVAEQQSPWHASLENESCVLQRSFSVSDGTIVLEIRQNSPNRYFEISVLSNSLNRTSADPRTQFGQSSEQMRHEHSYRISNGDWTGFRSTVPADYFQSSEANSGTVPLIVTRAFDSDFEIPLDLKDPMTVLQECTDVLLASWGLNPEVEGSLSQRIGEPKSYKFMTGILRNMPKSSSRGGSKFSMRLIVGVEGIPTACALLDEYRNSEFETFACEQAIKKARFDPALDQSGAPVPSYTIVSGYVSRS